MEDQTDSGTPAKSRSMPFRYVSQSREIVRQFTPNWFAMTMGAGIVFLVLLSDRHRIVVDHYRCAHVARLFDRRRIWRGNGIHG